MKKCLIIIIVILLIVIGYLYLQNRNCEYSLIQYKSVPRIGLTNTLDFSGDNLYRGIIKGFVAFDNIEDQPHDLTQYYIIEPLNKFDENGNQLFSIDEIIAYYNLAPASIGIDELIVKSDTSLTLTLEDSYGNQFFINKFTKEVSMRDATGDNTSLITSNSEYEDFMRDFLTK